MKRILAGGWIGLKRRLQKMKDIDALLKNLCLIHVTVVMLTATSFEQMQSCDLFACQLPSPGLLSLFAISFFSSALLYTKFRAEF